MKYHELSTLAASDAFPAIAHPTDREELLSNIWRTSSNWRFPDVPSVPPLPSVPNIDVTCHKRPTAHKLYNGTAGNGEISRNKRT